MTPKPWLIAAGTGFLLTATGHIVSQLAPSPFPAEIAELIAQARQVSMTLPGGVERTIPDMLEGLGWGYAASLLLGVGFAFNLALDRYTSANSKRIPIVLLLAFAVVQLGISASWFFVLPLTLAALSTVCLTVATILAFKAPARDRQSVE